MIPDATVQMGASPGEIFVGIGYIKLVIGFGITIIGLQGYRRNQSRPMLFLALGIAGITFLSTLGALMALWIVTDPVPGSTAIVKEVVELFGVLCVAYSLYLLKRR